MFGFLKKKEDDKIVLASPVKGKAVPLGEVSDPIFSEELLGKGIAVIPTEGKIYAPADGEVTMIFDTLHAVSLTNVEGVEILIHVGIDTVNLKGEGFKSHIKAGDQVKKGDLLLTVDLDVIKNAEYDTITPIIISNSDDYAEVRTLTLGEVDSGDEIISILK